MATVKISALPEASALALEDYTLIIKDGKAYKVSAQTLAEYLGGMTLTDLVVAATEAQQVITPPAGSYYKKVTVQPINAKEITVTPTPAAQTITPNAGEYIKKVIVPSNGQYVANEPITPTGTYATATYYNLAYGVKIGYMSNGDILLSMQGGTTTSYEYLYFTLEAAPAGVTLQAATTFATSAYATAAPGNIYACVLSGITKDVQISIVMDTRDATYDWTQCKITVTEV